MAFKLTYSDGQSTDYDDSTKWEVDNGVVKMGRDDGEWTVFVSPSHWATLELGPAKKTTKAKKEKGKKDKDDDKGQDDDKDQDEDEATTRTKTTTKTKTTTDMTRTAVAAIRSFMTLSFRRVGIRSWLRHCALSITRQVIVAVIRRG